MLKYIPILLILCSCSMNNVDDDFDEDFVVTVPCGTLDEMLDRYEFNVH